MVQRVETWMIDDLDHDSSATETVAFALDGVSYEIDLSSENASKLRDDLRPWQHNGRRVGARKPAGASKRSKPPTQKPQIDPSQARAIREWANANGYTVSPRGKIPAAVHEAFEAAH